MASYYRRHVPNFADIALPLTKLTKKNEKFRWEDEQEKAFQKLKDILSTEPLLIYPDFSQPFIAACDASNTAIAAILSQLRMEKKSPLLIVVDN